MPWKCAPKLDNFSVTKIASLASGRLVLLAATLSNAWCDEC